jgi:hypothetical protein
MFKSVIAEFKKFRSFKKNIYSFNQYEEYIDKKVSLPSLHIIKQNNIHKYRELFNVAILVETGTYLGDMVEAQKSYFKQVFSIELGLDLYQKAVERFKADKNVKILQGDSGNVLKDLVPKINEPVLFWLDGHYSAGATAKSDKNTPILAEMEVILNQPLGHVILIDDARLFGVDEDYPSIPELCQFILSIKPDRKIIVADDIISVTP